MHQKCKFRNLFDIQMWYSFLKTLYKNYWPNKYLIIHLSLLGRIRLLCSLALQPLPLAAAFSSLKGGEPGRCLRYQEGSQLGWGFPSKRWEGSLPGETVSSLASVGWWGAPSELTFQVQGRALSCLAVEPSARRSPLLGWDCGNEAGRHQRCGVGRPRAGLQCQWERQQWYPAAGGVSPASYPPPPIHAVCAGFLLPSPLGPVDSDDHFDHFESIHSRCGPFWRGKKACRWAS